MTLSTIAPGVPDADSNASLTSLAPSPRRAPRFGLTRETDEAGAAQSPEDLLLARLRRHDDAAYETLVRTYGPRMLVVARSYVPLQEDAEDVVQSAFVLVFRFIHRFEGASKLSTWLHRIVVNCALMRIRSGKRRPETSLAAFEDGFVAERVAQGGLTIADELEAREIHARLLRAVASLPETLRAPVLLRDVDGLTLAETSRLLGRSLTAVKTSVHRGRIALRAVLGADGERKTLAREAPMRRSDAAWALRPRRDGVRAPIS